MPQFTMSLFPNVKRKPNKERREKGRKKQKTKVDKLRSAPHSVLLMRKS